MRTRLSLNQLNRAARRGDRRSTFRQALLQEQALLGLGRRLAEHELLIRLGLERVSQDAPLRQREASRPVARRVRNLVEEISFFFYYAESR